MDASLLPLLVVVVATVVATTVGALPERIDVTTVFGAYAIGTIIGTAIASRRPDRDATAIIQRWGMLLLLVVALLWCCALAIGGLR